MLIITSLVLMQFQLKLMSHLHHCYDKDRLLFKYVWNGTTTESNTPHRRIPGDPNDFVVQLFRKKQVHVNLNAGSSDLEFL